jgi:hypothetical protein
MADLPLRCCAAGKPPQNDSIFTHPSATPFCALHAFLIFNKNDSHSYGNVALKCLDFDNVCKLS